MSKLFEVFATALAMAAMLAIVLFCVVLPVSHIRGSGAGQRGVATLQTGTVKRLYRAGLLFKNWEGDLDTVMIDLCQPDVVPDPVLIRFTVSSETLLGKIKIAQASNVTVTIVLDPDHYVVDVR